MDIFTISTLFNPSIVLFLCFMVTIYWYVKYVVYNFWNRKGVPHEPPTIPLGNIPISYFTGETIHGSILKDSYMKFKHHRFHGLYVLCEPVLIINDPQLIQNIMVKNFTKFYNRGNFIDEKDALSITLTRMNDEKWKSLRRKLSPTFTSGKLKLMYPFIEEICFELINAVDKSLEKNDEIEFKEFTLRYTVDCISSIAYGFNADTLHNLDSAFWNYGKHSNYIGRVFILFTFFIPQLAKIIPVPKKRKSNMKFFTKIFLDIVEERRKCNISRNDFVNMLMQLMDHGTIDKENGISKQNLSDKSTETDKLSMMEAVGQSFIFFSAAKESTSSVTTCCLYELALDPEIQEQLFNEVREVQMSPGGLTYEKLFEMQYLDMVFQETLRKYPGTSVINRICTEDFQVPDSNFRITKGMRIAIPLSGLHADPDIFPQPEKFDPTRFTPENSAKRHSFTYLPFGDGPRQCIGKRLGILKSKIALFYLIWNYEFLPSENTPSNITFLSDYFVQVPCDVPLKIKRRRLQEKPESSSAAELKIATCEALGRFPINEDARRVLIHVKITEALYHLVTGSEALPVRSAATRLLLLLCSDPILARLCVQQGHLFYMLKNRASARAIPEWSGCVEALFGADLPMKFAYTGRLSLRDVSQDGFYVMRRSSCPFPVLEELFRLKLCPLEPIYVANFREGRGNESDDEDEEELEYLAGKQAAFDAAREVIRRESYERGIRVSEGTINAWLELKFGRLQPDPVLSRYLLQLKAELSADEEANNDETYPPNLITASTIARRAAILGRFVARQLSGLDPSSISCTNQQLEMHLRAIKEKIETSVVPLGLLRFGSYLERALLFKVLADRIALPASLVRGGYGTSWIEIAVPTTSDGKSSAPLPRDYLRENFIVDLMDEPGRLIAIGSVGARRYVDGQSGCRRVGCCD